MSRADVREVRDASPIVPVAKPVDSYVRPETPARSNLHQLADGLAAFDRGLSSYLGKKRGKQNDADRIRGEAAFNRNNQVAWGQAVEQGLVPPHSSPIFMEAYKTAQGNLMGIQLSDKFRDTYATWDRRNEADDDEFQTFYSDFIGSNVGTDDPHILAGLNPYISTLTHDAYKVRSNEQAAAAYNGALETTAAIQGEVIDYSSAEGLVSGNGTDYDKLWTNLTDLRTHDLTSGIKASDYDTFFVDTIIAKALDEEDPELLNLLDRTLPGAEHALSFLPTFRDAKARALDVLDGKIRRRVVEEGAAQQAIDKKAKLEITTKVSRFISDNPTASIPEELLQQWERYDGMARSKAATIQKNLSDATALEDPQTVIQLYADVREGATEEDLNYWVASGMVSNPSTYKALLASVEKRRVSGAEGSGLLTSQTAKRYHKLFLGQLGDSPDGDYNPFGGKELSPEYIQAITDFETMLMDWEVANPDGTLQDREGAINAIGKIISERIDLDRRLYEEPQSTSQPDEAVQEQGVVEPTSTAPEVPTVEPEDNAVDMTDGYMEAFKEFQGNPLNLVPNSQGEALDPYAEGPPLQYLPDDVQDFVRNEAKRLGVSPQDYNKTVWKHLKNLFEKQPEGGEVTPSSFDEDAAAEALNDAIDDAPATNSTVDLVAMRTSHKKLDHVEDEVVTKLASLEQSLGFELGINSGYRDPAKNKKVGGAKKSMHIHKKAIDTDVSMHSTAKRIEIIKRASAAGFTGIGVYNNAIHLDTGDLRSWGATYKRESVPKWAEAVIRGHLAGKYSNATKAHKHSSEPFLNFIGVAEGSGNTSQAYNTTFGEGRYTGGAVVLTGKTLNEVDTLQTQMLRHPGNKHNSSALGKYQITRTTMRRLRKQLKLKGGEKYTPELQDQMALELLKLRGLAKWQAGKITDKAFLNRLAKEWASLPTSSGVGYYRGQKARVHKDDVLAALKTLKT